MLALVQGISALAGKNDFAAKGLDDVFQTYASVRRLAYKRLQGAAAAAQKIEFIDLPQELKDMCWQFDALDGYLLTDRRREISLTKLAGMLRVGTRRDFDIQKFREIAVVRPDFFACTWKKQELNVRAAGFVNGSLEQLKLRRSEAFRDELAHKFSSRP